MKHVSGNRDIPVYRGHINRPLYLSRRTVLRVCNRLEQHQRLERPAISHFFHPYVLVILEYVVKKPSCLFERDVDLSYIYDITAVVSLMLSVVWRTLRFHLFNQQIHNKVDRTIAFK